MYPGDSEKKTLEEYRLIENQLHHDLMNACRKYISELGIVSIIGMLDIVKQETIELERATKRTFKNEEFEIDKKGKDTWRHMESGAEAVIMVSSSKVALIEKVSQELSLDELAGLYIEPYDIIIAEGFKHEKKPKIEVARKDLSEEL